ncbi:hypothetical protein CBL_20202 [Carabus blaptoides fortunei]
MPRRFGLKGRAPRLRGEAGLRNLPGGPAPQHRGRRKAALEVRPEGPYSTPSGEVGLRVPKGGPAPQHRAHTQQFHPVTAPPRRPGQARLRTHRTHTCHQHWH